MCVKVLGYAAANALLFTLGGIIKCLDSLAKPHHIMLYQILGGSFVYNLYTEDYVSYFVLNTSEAKIKDFLVFELSARRCYLNV